MNAPTLAVTSHELSVKFAEFMAVDRVSFTVQQGEIFGFLGANGAGKTTTIRVLCGLLPPTSGMVEIAGARYSDGEAAIKARVGYMSQRFTLYDDLSVEENLYFTAQLRRLERSTYQQRQRELLALVEFSGSLAVRVGHLPAGLKQQVALVAALVHDPPIIFLDEPTAGVSPAARSRFWSLIRLLQERGKTIFVTTHYMDEAENCGRIALLGAGKLIALDTLPKLRQQAFPEPIYGFEVRGQPLSNAELTAFRSDPALRSFEPFGIRYHAVPRSAEAFAAARQRFAQRFVVREIQPSLEDVFIELTESRSRT